MQFETRIETHVKMNTSIAGNVTKYSNLHTQESLDKKILTLPNFAYVVTFHLHA